MNKRRGSVRIAGRPRWLPFCADFCPVKPPCGCTMFQDLLSSLSSSISNTQVPDDWDDPLVQGVPVPVKPTHGFRTCLAEECPGIDGSQQSSSAPPSEHAALGRRRALNSYENRPPQFFTVTKAMVPTKKTLFHSTSAMEPSKPRSLRASSGTDSRAPKQSLDRPPVMGFLGIPPPRYSKALHRAPNARALERARRLLLRNCFQEWSR